MHIFYSNLHLRKASGMQAVMNEVVKVDYLHEISNTDQKTQTSSHNTDQKTTKNSKKKKISMKSIATTTMAMLESAKKNQEKDSNSASTANTKKRFSMQNSIEDFGSVEQFIPFSASITETAKNRKSSIAKFSAGTLSNIQEKEKNNKSSLHDGKESSPCKEFSSIILDSQNQKQSDVCTFLIFLINFLFFYQRYPCRNAG